MQALWKQFPVAAAETGDQELPRRALVGATAVPGAAPPPPTTERPGRWRRIVVVSKYLISFPSAAMVVAAEDLPAVSESSHAVVREAKTAGVWVFGGGIDERVPPVLVDADGTVTDGTYPQRRQIAGGYAVLDLPTRTAALEWAAKLAEACRCPQEVRVFGDDPES